MMEQHLLLGDSKDVLKQLKDGSIDLLATDPPYGIEFMGKSWDKVLPDKEIWTECYRVLKPGSFIAVMSSPRSDVLYRMIKDLEDAGFDMSFSPILWTYHTGFPKASDTSKMIDKRLGAEREVVGRKEGERYKYDFTSPFRDDAPGLGSGDAGSITAPSTDLAKKYEGSKLGFQPKPAVEHIIIGMKPHGSKSYIDNVLNFEALPDNIKMTYPFIQVPKPSKSERNFGMEHKVGVFSQRPRREDGTIIYKETHPDEWKEAMDKLPRKDRTSKAAAEEKLQEGNEYKGNKHPTIKPVKLMSYIITLFTREGDFVLDPFLGSGTTGIASKLMGRSFVGIEREQEYMDIAQERCGIDRDELIKFFRK
jgi:site-specific DNA-methyltransferase (adenine-specific)